MWYIFSANVVQNFGGFKRRVDIIQAKRISSELEYALE
jgi:hypothetical protein